MAASDGLMVTVKGTGGHGSAPHRAKDPVSVAAEIITALQAMVTRQFDIFDPVVITVGSFHAGTRRNIIPEEAVFEATVRSFSRAARERIQVASVRLCEAIAAAHGLEADARYNTEYPVTVNDVAQAAFATGVVADVFGEDRFTPMPNPEAGAEDFSRVLEEVPGCYLFLGACVGDDYRGGQRQPQPVRGLRRRRDDRRLSPAREPGHPRPPGPRRKLRAHSGQTADGLQRPELVLGSNQRRLSRRFYRTQQRNYSLPSELRQYRPTYRRRHTRPLFSHDQPQPSAIRRTVRREGKHPQPPRRRARHRGMPAPSRFCTNP